MKTCKFYGSFFSLLLNCVLSLEENAVLAVLLAVSLDSIVYDPNSSTRLKNIKRHETELKWIKLLQSPFPLGFNDNIYSTTKETHQSLRKAFMEIRIKK